MTLSRSRSRVRIAPGSPRNFTDFLGFRPGLLVRPHVPSRPQRGYERTKETKESPGRRSGRDPNRRSAHPVPTPSAPGGLRREAGSAVEQLAEEVLDAVAE